MAAPPMRLDTMEAPLTPNDLSEIDVVLDFLDAHPITNYDECIVKTELEHNKASVSSINALVTICAFVAGVQVAVIAITWQSNDTALQVVTNLFSFVGLVFDVMGTSHGVAHIMALQQRIQGFERLESSQQRMHDIREWRNANVSDPLGLLGTLTLLQQEVALREEIAKQREACQDRMLLRRGVAHAFWHLINDSRRRGKTLILAPAFSLIKLSRITSSTSQPGEALGIMFYGISALLLSVLCFSANSQPRSVWCSCVALTAVLLLARQSSMMSKADIRKNVFRDSRTRLRQLEFKHAWST